MTNQQLLKTISLVAVSLIAALVFGLLLKAFLNVGNLTSLILATIGSLAFLAIFLIQTLLLDNFLINLVTITADVILILIVFVSNLSVILLVAGIIMIAFLIAAYYEARLDLRSNLEIRFFKISGYVIRRASSALAIFAIIAYLSSLNLKDPVAARKALTVALRPAEPITAAYIPGFTIKSSLLEVAARLMPPDVRLASDEVKAEFIKQSSSRLSATIGGFTRTAVKPTDSTLDIVYKATVVKLLKLSPFAQNLILVAVGLVAFFFLKFFLIFVNWGATFLALGIYRILWGAGFFKVELESKTKQVIVL